MKRLTAILVIASIMLIGYAVADTPLDITQAGAYPYSSYLAQSCGGQTRTQVDVGLVAFYSAKTTCSTGGRGAKPRTYLACWQISFASDAYVITDRMLVKYATWRAGEPAEQCPSGW